MMIDVTTSVPRYRWASEVKKLHGGVCAFCGSSEGLEAHHIESRSLRPNLGNDLTNGIALCHKHHLLAHGGSYYRIHQQRKLGQAAIYAKNALPVMEFIESTISIIVTEGQKAAIQAAADAVGESINGYTQKALLARMGLDEWEEGEDEKNTPDQE